MHQYNPVYMLNFHQSSLYWTDGDKTNNKCIKLSQHGVLFCLLLYIITVRIPDLHKFQLLRSKKVQQLQQIYRIAQVPVLH